MPFQKGNQLAKRKGSNRERVAKNYLSRIRADFRKYGIEAIQRVRQENPVQYLQLIARLIPAEYEVTNTLEAGQSLRDLSRQEVAARMLGILDKAQHEPERPTEAIEVH